MTAPPARLRSLLEAAAPVIAPGAFNALFAKLIEEAGFPAVYLSGAGVSNSLLGEPDLGILTQTEMAGIADHVCRAVDVPVVADGDTGYGGVHNVARTIELYERAGVAGIQIEDQAFPKKCGHFEGKEVVAPEQMLQRIHAARDARTGSEGIVIIARTDARAPLGLDAAIERAHAYGEAGADVLFVEAPQTPDELARVGSELSDYHLMANMVEFGKTPLLPADELGALGFSLIIYPGSITRAIVPAARAVLNDLRAKGTTAGRLDEMATFGDVNDLLDLDEANRREAEIAARARGEAST
jgi:2-methylisocitrate lyase-like PEP mutase family enzyme